LYDSLFGDGEELVGEGGLVDDLEGHLGYFWQNLALLIYSPAIKMPIK